MNQGRLVKHWPISLYILVHVFFAALLGRFYALAPDEPGYLYTFNNIYGSSNPNPQFNSGWLSSPKIFLWIIYSPAKILNLIGVSDILSIRILSILLGGLSILLLSSMRQKLTKTNRISRNFIFVFYFIPSIFLWTTLGMRESFIIVEIAAFLVGFALLVHERNKRGYILLFLGSYGLLSTKNYLWAVLMLATIVCSVIVFRQNEYRRKILETLAVGLIAPVILFSSTTSFSAWSFLINVNVTATGQRTGDSIIQVPIDTPGTGTGTGTGTVSLNGDTTLFLLHDYLINNPDSFGSKVLKFSRADVKIKQIWDEKLQFGLISESQNAKKEDLSLNGRSLKPGILSDPITLIWPAFMFLCGPFPLVGDQGIAASIASLESPLWWAFYAFVLFQFVRPRRVKILQDPTIILGTIFLIGCIVLSALAEVNLGTSFRHRSILLVPLIFIFLRMTQSAEEEKSSP